MEPVSGMNMRILMMDGFARMQIVNIVQTGRNILILVVNGREEIGSAYSLQKIKSLCGGY